MNRFIGAKGDQGFSSAPNKFEVKEPLFDRNRAPISTEKLEYLKAFIIAKLGHLDEKTVENALIVLGDGAAIQKRNVGPLSFYDLLADTKQYYAVVHGHYDSMTNILSFFSGASPEDKNLRRVAFVVDFDKQIMGERIIRVDFHDGSDNPHLKALEGLQVSGGFGLTTIDMIRK